MAEPSTQLQQALDLVGRDPLPDDVRERLRELEDQAPAGEAERFGDLWEVVLIELGPEPEDA